MQAEDIRPVLDRIYIRPDSPLEKTKGGIIIPDKAKDAPQSGTVVNVGGKVTLVKAGDKVLFNAHNKVNLKDLNLTNEDVYVNKEEDIEGVIE